MIIRAKLRTKILLHLPKRYAETVAAECGCHVNTVYNVLLHERENDTVALALLKLSNKTKEAKDKVHLEATQIAEQL